MKYTKYTPVKYALFLLMLVFSCQSVYAEEGETEILSDEPLTPIEEMTEAVEQETVIPEEPEVLPIETDETDAAVIPEEVNEEITTPDEMSVVPVSEENENLSTEQTDDYSEIMPAEMPEENITLLSVSEEPEPAGFISDGEKTYYYDPLSHQSVTGGVVIDNNGYYFNEDGSMCVNTWVDHGNNMFSYYDENGKLLRNTFATLMDESGEAEHLYYINRSGYRVTGSQLIDNYGYWFDDYGIALQNGWKDYGKKGFAYYDENGRLLKNSFATLQDENQTQENLYYLSSSGYRVSGRLKINNNGYFFNDNGAALQNSWKNYGTQGYAYYGSDGKLLKNTWKTLLDENGNQEHTYYLNTHGYRAVGRQTVNGTTLQFDKNGVLLNAGKPIVIGGDGYYFDNNGVMLVNSWKDYGIKGFAYYGADGKLLKNKWAVLSDENGENTNTYYLNQSGYRLTGAQVIGGNGYFFLNNGTLITDTWKNYGARGWAYYGPDGKLLKNTWAVLPDENKESVNTYYLNQSGYRLTGAQAIGGNGYFFQNNGAMTKNVWMDYGAKGWAYYGSDGRLYKNIWISLTDETGTFDNLYYFMPTGYRAVGAVVIDHKGYSFDNKGIMLKNSWKNYGSKGWAYYGNNGQLYQNKWSTLRDETDSFENLYYFTASGYRAVGGIAIDDKGYFFDDKGIMLRNSWKNYGSKGWAYYGDNGQLYQNRWSTLRDETDSFENLYYFTSSGYRAIGATAIEGKGYFFDNKGIMLRNSWKNYGSKGWAYYGDNGQLYSSVWANLLNENGTAENRYYFTKSGFRAVGLNTISGTKYYFNEKTGALLKDEFKKLSDGRTIYVDGNGKVAVKSFTRKGIFYAVSPNNYAIMKGPSDFTYYSQLDGRWSGIRYGRYSFGSSGCGVTSLAMVISSLKGTSVTPNQVADYLYNNTSTYNAGAGGNTGSSNFAAASHWDIECENINSRSDLERVLKDGMVVSSMMDPGDFCPPGVTHQIVLYGYSSGSVRVYDPLGNASSGWYSISSVWDQLSTSGMDNDAGNPVFVFYKQY